MNKIHAFFNRMDKAFRRVFRILTVCFCFALLAFVFINSWHEFGLLTAVLILVIPIVFSLSFVFYLWRWLIKREGKR
jgi:hypothetical protein